MMAAPSPTSIDKEDEDGTLESPTRIAPI